MRLVYSARAVADLARLRAFIAENDPQAAARVARELLDRMEHLRDFPQMGRNVDAAPEPGTIRDFAFGRYVVRSETVFVLRVWHELEGRRSGRLA